VSQYIGVVLLSLLLTTTGAAQQHSSRPIKIGDYTVHNAGRPNAAAVTARNSHDGLMYGRLTFQCAEGTPEIYYSHIAGTSGRVFHRFSGESEGTIGTWPKSRSGTAVFVPDTAIVSFTRLARRQNRLILAVQTGGNSKVGYNWYRYQFSLRGVTAALKRLPCFESVS
jgi:hypothetical protein